MTRCMTGVNPSKMKENINGLLFAISFVSSMCLAIKKVFINELLSSTNFLPRSEYYPIPKMLNKFSA